MKRNGTKTASGAVADRDDEVIEKYGEMLTRLFERNGFDMDAVINNGWSDQHPVARYGRSADEEVKAYGFVRAELNVGDECINIYRFTHNEVLLWQITNVQFTSVPFAMLDAIVCQARNSLKTPAKI